MEKIIFIIVILMINIIFFIIFKFLRDEIIAISTSSKYNISITNHKMIYQS